MGQPVTPNALRRKTLVGQRAREVQGLTPTRAVRIALARAAGDLWELPLSVTALRHDLIDVDRLADQFDEDELMLLLDGPDGVRGGMAVDRALLTSVTEVQTIGAVTERPPNPRPYTPTDAALFAPLVDAMLERVDVSLHGADETAAACDRHEAAWALGYRFGAKVDRLRALLLALESEAFHVLRLEIDIGAGLRRGGLLICLPDRAMPRGEDEESEIACPPGAHADALAAVPTQLAATLPSLHLPLSRATGLKTGDVLSLEQGALQNLVLRASDGRSMARCTLGKIGEMRALRLQAARGQHAPPPPEPPAGGDGFSTGVRPSGPVAPASERFVPHARGDAPASSGTPQDETFPDLPPLDFDAPQDSADRPAAARDLSSQDVGNTNFE
jgi:flagellar motor switch protein FliM